MKLPHLLSGAKWTAIVIAMVVTCLGCANPSTHARGDTDSRVSAVSPDIREVMLASARTNDKRFPDGREVALTQFAYIGTVTTKDGLIRVVACRAVMTGMLSPRGQSWLSLHAKDGAFVSSQLWFSGDPLWCEGSRIYFFGLQGSDEEGVGNALDLAAGVKAGRWVMEDREGSWTTSVTSSAGGQ